MTNSLIFAALLGFGTTPVINGDVPGSFGAQMPEAKATMTLDAKRLVSGGKVSGIVTLKLPDGWHAYQNPPMKDSEIPVTLRPASGNPSFRCDYPKGAATKLFGEDTIVYEGSIAVPFTFETTKKPGKYAFSLIVGYQMCDDSQCLPESKVTLKGLYEIVRAIPVKKP
jgi:DsbC/DsbD-like thiol-disulfide interchange protein